MLVGRPFSLLASGDGHDREAGAGKLVRPLRRRLLQHDRLQSPVRPPLRNGGAHRHELNLAVYDRSGAQKQCCRTHLAILGGEFRGAGSYYARAVPQDSSILFDQVPESNFSSPLF